VTMTAMMEGTGHSIDRDIVRTIAPPLDPYDDLILRHKALLSEITTAAGGSAIYKERIRPISCLEDLSDIPLTSYLMMDQAIEKNGLDACLLRAPDHTFQTSGSTGNPKRMFYSRADVDRVARDFVLFCQVVGLSRGDVGWNLGGAFPNVSGEILERTCDRAGIEKLTTLLTKDSDLVQAMKRASKTDRIDAMVSAALVLYFVGQTVKDPEFLRGVVQNKLQRDYHLPRPLARLAARLYLRGLDDKQLARTLSRCKIAFTYAEPLTPYLHDLRERFPGMAFHDVFGSTENPILAAQLDPAKAGLSLFLSSAIPEIADPAEVAEAKEGHRQRVAGVPWFAWTKGMRGELIITRPGECLPLVRYPTGDLIEVLDPAWTHRAVVDGQEIAVTLPLIKVLGREVEALDFEVQDEGGCFLGNKIYSRHIHEALQRPYNIRWWELYNIKGTPGRLCFLIIPDHEVTDMARFKKETLRHLFNECDDPNHALAIGHELGRLDILVTRTSAYEIVQRDIDRRMREGRSLGQLKPKRIHVLEDEKAFKDAVKERINA
jgi:phenylacetate-coenzyme A ligase PaaK-like adenylate-forming protein